MGAQEQAGTARYVHDIYKYSNRFFVFPQYVISRTSQETNLNVRSRNRKLTSAHTERILLLTKRLYSP